MGFAPVNAVCIIIVMHLSKAKTCIFCGTPLDNNNRSKEHVIPTWLSQHLNIKGQIVTPSHQSASTGDIISKRKHTIDKLIEGRICATCNNQWMSSIETLNQPLLIELMDSHKHLSDLKNNQRIQIARWACKTAWLLNSSSNYIHNIPLEHFRHIYTNVDTLPSRVIVVAQQHSATRPFCWIQGSAWPIEFGDDLSEAEVKELSKNAYKIGLQLRDLMILIAFWPHEGWFYSMQMNLHIPLWPLCGMCGWHNGTSWHEHESEKAFYGFTTSLMIITKERLQQCKCLTNGLHNKSI